MSTRAFVYFLFCRGGHKPRKGRKRQNVGNYHKLIKHIRKLPDKVVGKAGADEHKYNRKNCIDLLGLFAEKIGDVYFSEEVPPYYG